MWILSALAASVAPELATSSRSMTASAPSTLRARAAQRCPAAATSSLVVMDLPSQNSSSAGPFICCCARYHAAVQDPLLLTAVQGNM
jgi:hypothetical protein